MQRVVSDGIAVLVGPMPGSAAARAGLGRPAVAFMRRVLATEHGGGLYAKRKA